MTKECMECKGQGMVQPGVGEGNKECPNCYGWGVHPGSISDGYHTFDELYDHRNLLFIHLCVMTPWRAKWRPHYPGWPVLFLEMENGKQISYHVPDRFLPLFEKVIAKDKEEEYQYDGHTSEDVKSRMIDLLSAKALMKAIYEEKKDS